MSTEGCAPRREPLSGDQPLPPADCRAQDGWRADVEALHRDRADQLIRHFASGSTDRETVRDIVHEAFARFTGLSFARRLLVTRPDAYLYTMCANLLRDRARAQK